jgi:hypothetical protein
MRGASIFQETKEKSLALPTIFLTRLCRLTIPTNFFFMSNGQVMNLVIEKAFNC